MLCFFLLLIWSSTVKAQLIDTISYSLHQKPKFFVTLASFYTYIDHDPAIISGVKTGVTYNQRLRFGLGYYNLTNNSVVSDIQIDEVNQHYTTAGNLHFYFFSLSGDYHFYNKYPWQLTATPFNVGIGSAKYEYVYHGDKIMSPSELIIFYQPEASVQYCLFKGLGFGLTTGYRISLYRSKQLTQNFNAPMFAFDVRVFVDELYKLIFEEE